MKDTYTLLAVQVALQLGSTVAQWLIAAILLQMAFEDKHRGDAAAVKAEEVKETLKESSDKLAKESTLQELKDKAKVI